MIEQGDELTLEVRAALIDRDALRALVVDSLHLFVLCGFAFAQPLFHILGHGATFFVARDASPSDVVSTALEIAFVPPALLFAAELLAQAVFGRWGRRVAHVLFVGVLLALIALPVVRRSELVASTGTLLGVSAAVGGVGALAYVRARQVRAFLTFLIPAPLLFLALFLLASPASRLVFPGSAGAAGFSESKGVPVVVVVFDEFSGTSLMNRHGAIDATRFPNFAELARGSLWFRNAMTSALATERAIPALVTGDYSRFGSLAVFQDHPQNLFTLVAGSHALDVHETETHLCPPHLCPGAANTISTAGISGLASDLAIVYGRFALPASLADRLPSIATRWGNFRGRRGPDSSFTQAPVFNRFLATLRANSRPTLHFVHVELPHVPWHYLPSGHEYPAPNDIPGLDDELWAPDPWVVLQAQERYLLQVGYVDRLVGRLLRRLKATGLYRRALVVVTADHGVSFHAGEGRRTTTRHLEDLAFVPLFIKLPGQTLGRVVERPVATIGVLPAIANVLDLRPSWHVDGRSVLDRYRLARIRIENRLVAVRPLLARRDEDLVAQSRLFGAGRSWSGIYAVGPSRDLIGKPVAALNVGPEGPSTARLDDAYRFSAVDLHDDVLPTYVSGTLETPGPQRVQDLVLAVNGTIVASSRSSLWHGTPSFSFVLPESALRAGGNDVDVYSVSRSTGVLLRHLGGVSSIPASTSSP